MPQTITKQYIIYTVEELSDDALNRAHGDYINSDMSYYFFNKDGGFFHE